MFSKLLCVLSDHDALAPHIFPLFHCAVAGCLLICVFAVTTSRADNEASSTAITVDGAETLGPLPRLAGYLNNSLRYAPPPKLAKLAANEYGKPEIMRCWLCLDDLWDYRDDTYYYNYRIGKDIYQGDKVKSAYDRGGVAETDVMYYDYIDAFSKHSKSILLNVRRYETEVVKGVISMDQWRKVVTNGLRHYKKRCPNIEYIEVLNEYTVKHFGGLDDDQYYEFYRVMYGVINELNAELKPEIPLKVGGPAWHLGHIRNFLKRYAADPDPNKRLDFLTYHKYTTDPRDYSNIEEKVDAWLAEHDLPTNIPIFITELGDRDAKKAEDPSLKQLYQATGVPAFLYQTLSQPDLYGFPWVLYHNPDVQFHHLMFDGQLRVTPFGAAMKMLSMQKSTRLAVTGGPKRNNKGKGFYALASKDDSGLAIQLWRKSPDGPDGQVMSVNLTVDNLPDALTGGKVRIRQYRVDSRHSNVVTNPDWEGGLELINEATVKVANSISLSLELEPLGLWMAVIELEQ